MKQYKDLINIEKAVHNRLESIWSGSSLKQKSFVTVLGVLINKYKIKRFK